MAATKATEDLILTCSKCQRTIPYRGNRDPKEGNGHPQHRCLGGRIIHFDRVRPGKISTVIYKN